MRVSTCQLPANRTTELFGTALAASGSRQALPKVRPADVKKKAFFS
jgi:hypothetical protein